MAKVIPYTAMMRRYHALEGRERALRLADAKALNVNDLASDFASAVDSFARGYSNAYEPFVPSPGTRAKSPNPVNGPILDTNDLVERLKKASKVVSTTSAPAGVHPQSTLSFRIVEREVSLIRTTDGAKYDDLEQGMRSAGKGIVCDLLCIDADDKTPIVCEIKVTKKDRTDMDPYSGLIQGLAAAAHLVTPSQYGRLRHYYPRRFRKDTRLVDVVVLTGSFNPGITHMEALQTEAHRIAAALIGHGSVSDYVRRIAFLDASPRGRGATVRAVAVFGER